MIAIVLLTLVILLIPFLFLFFNLKKQTKTRRILLILGYFICAAPMVYVVIDDWINHYEDANIGLGLGIFLTWGLTACVYLGWCIFSVIKAIRKANK
ncbi:hypothetical protein [Niallia taxi]|uniref:hypothetical protein n=1 Tax=Niallia taxi TaxID=2499688 RepID=UPI0021A82A76|nr:hypothetical protein [Niallia taxi]MCT2346430.1 hypothetical protein [Niallia taxi]MDE5053338.1 hypothetical protein [Niallia taxi]MED3963372.1 hypothetical protein [Niallia taxi]WOD61311.1 hypothetical protein NQZ71_10765 [Niallia taxi]